MNEKELAIYIGQRIKDFRLSRNMTQKELAKRIGMGDTTIANYEKGFRSPKKD
ncbi:TPA: helix-turn-helix transcriptional regulator, partial [Streptococcus suis]|nr:helix-turn-helix transcriptional regulator [Streptococcus suis]